MNIVIFPPKVYDFLKFLALVLLPGLGTLYVALAAVWHFGYATEVSGTVLAVDTFLGVVLGISSATYKNSDARFDGTMHVSEQDNSKIHQLEITGDPDAIASQKVLTLRVNQVPADSPPIQS